MNTHPQQKIICGILIIVLMAGLLPAQYNASAAPTAAGVLSLSIPGLDFLGAWIGRDMTYNSAEEYITERNKYYNNLRDTLRVKFKEYVKGLTSGSSDTPKINPMRDSQVAAHVVQVALIEQQRKSAMAFAEAVKKGAKRNFDQALKREIQDRVMATGMMQRVFGAIISGLGMAQTMVNAVNNKLDQIPGIDLKLRQLRTLSDQLRDAMGVFNGPSIDGLEKKLRDLSSKLRSKTGISRDELNEVSQQIGAFKSRLEGLSAPDQLQIAGNEIFGDLGMQLVGFSQGTAATQAILNLLSRRHGVSYEQIRAQGLALLAAGDKARCRAKAEAIQQALQQLALEQGEEIKLKPPSELCNEINADGLINPNNLTTSPGKNNNTSGTGNPDDVEFSTDSCACEDFKVIKAEPWGSSSLSCAYEWIGPNGEKNSLSFEVSQIYHLDEQNPALQDELSDMQYLTADIQPPEVANVFLDDPSNLGVGAVVTGPGGFSSTTNREIPLCGNGKGTYPYSNNYLITTRMSACDLGEDAQAYITAMQTLAECAMRSIDGRYPP
jgi:hypothetical protein